MENLYIADRGHALHKIRLTTEHTSSTQLSADTAYSALWHLLIILWQIPNRIFTKCRNAALQ